jgi:hypothetical protein
VFLMPMRAALIWSRVKLSAMFAVVKVAHPPLFILSLQIHFGELFTVKNE